MLVELWGALGEADAERLVARLAGRYEGISVVLEGGGGGCHRLRLTAIGSADSGSGLTASSTASSSMSPTVVLPVPSSESAEVHGSGREVGPSSASSEAVAWLPGELLADLLVPSLREEVPVVGFQRELLSAAVGGSGETIGAGTGGEGGGVAVTGGDEGVGQVTWEWWGPLDVGWFAEAWASVVEREVVLRAGFDWVAAPRLVMFGQAGAEEACRVVSTGTEAWEEWAVRERRRGFALYRPPLVRLLVMAGAGAGATARVVVTYHRALLDERGVRLLMGELLRAYACGGALPGGERRPDVRDYAVWRADRATGAAREWWRAERPPVGALSWPSWTPDLPVVPSPFEAPGAATGVAVGAGEGWGRADARLGAREVARLRSWAAVRGVGEGSVLHVVWALLLYRAARAVGVLPVSFGVQQSGRDVALMGAAHIPGRLGGPLPMTLRVDPTAPLAGLLRQSRDALLGLYAYPWVSGEQISEWSGAPSEAESAEPGDELRGIGRTSVTWGAGDAPHGERASGSTPAAVRDGVRPETVVDFEGRVGWPAGVLGDLAALGVRVGEAVGLEGGGGRPLTVTARHQADGGLDLTFVHDRAWLSDADAARWQTQCLELLRALAGVWDPAMTVGQALNLAPVEGTPRTAGSDGPLGETGRPRRSVVRRLRTGRPGADVVGLVAVPGVPPGCYERFARVHEGPEEIVVLRVGATGVSASVVPDVVGEGRGLVLAGCGPGGRVAYEIANGVGAGERGAPPVVMTGLGSAGDCAEALVRGLRSVLTSRPRP
ncbi:hypothetical protein [Streptomyces sp. NPDC005485]|uniref:hypothetical protein n=1 Tax=Streptomyces sp. NPDC005485 TaxID=3155591 RepID=UPI0033B8E1E6